MRVLENRAYSCIFGPKMEEVTGGWRKRNNKELNNLYEYYSTIIRMIKSRRWGM
jgi:hypothetical protein